MGLKWLRGDLTKIACVQTSPLPQKKNREGDEGGRGGRGTSVHWLSQEGDLITFLLQRRGLSEKGRVSKGLTIPLLLQLSLLGGHFTY